MRAISPIRAAGSLGCALLMLSAVGCFDDEPVPTAHPAGGGSTVVVSKPGVTSPQPVVQPTVVQQPAPAPQSAPPIINNVVEPPAAAAPSPTATAAPGTTVNVQPRTVNVP
jgi:hypothetical protein